jgi:hypothetical protein
MTKIRVAVVGLVALAVLAAVGLTSAVSAKPGQHEQHPKVSHSELVFHDAMRKLWEDHVTWTRMFIVEAAADSPATDATATRLLANQDDIGDAIKSFYGDEAGDQLAALLKEHILIAADILSAAKAGDQDGVAGSSERWYANADEIADFLAAANPEAWPAEEMRTMMREHLDLTLDEAVARLQGDFDADIAAYDTLHQQILHMADMLSDGIVAQFPDAFR